MLRERIAQELEDARRRTEALLAPVDEARLCAQHDALMSPLAWDYAHIGAYEEIWLAMQAGGESAEDPRLLARYDAFENPRAARGQLDLLDRAQTRSYRDRVRARVLRVLERADFASVELLRDGYVYRMVVEHEHQHCETILQALQMLPGGYKPPLPALPPGREVKLDMVHVPAGRALLGDDAHAPWDNEHPAHEIAWPAFRIDRFPVTCGQFLAFIDDGGYARRDLWSEQGWPWREQSGARAPKHWRREDGAWLTSRFGHTVSVREDEPVVHVCWYEAEAYARWAHKRLPTEAEWEIAARWDPAAGRMRRYPWGDEAPDTARANLDQWAFGPAPVGAYPRGASALGCEQMVGDVWEWTSSDFGGYPGYRAFPYREYSEVFFGPAYKVLRGASWAARGSVGRACFRNWDYPTRRQIFSGLRCEM